MNKKEAKCIAWNLYCIDDCARNVSGRDRAVEVANTALDSMHNIIETCSMIKIEFDKWKLTD